MTRKLTGLSQRYVAALRKHLEPGPHATPHNGAALRLGRQAVTLGLETLELARIHERALLTLGLACGKNGMIKRAEVFFTEANTQIEETHRAARQTKVHLSRVQETLGQRTVELAATNRQLRRGVARRKAMEDEFAIKGKHHQKYLAESLQLQNLVRQLTHRVLAAQEDERLKISHELQDEIVQTLVGIQVRLLALKHEARGNTKHLKNQIAKAQQLVVNSARSVRQFARKLNSPPPTLSDRSPATLQGGG